VPPRPVSAVLGGGPACVILRAGHRRDCVNVPCWAGYGWSSRVPDAYRLTGPV